MDGRRILVLDADRAFREEITGVLSDRGYQVEQRSSAREAARWLPGRNVRCALVDVDLEDMSGLQAIALLRARSPALKVIMTANENNREREAQVRREDVLYYYVKGFDRAELLQAIAGAVGEVK